MSEQARRPLATRSHPWARGFAAWLARKRCSPNAISALSIVCGAAAGGLWLAACSLTVTWQASTAFVLAGVAIQLRLLCNLLDGMVAVEGGLRSKTGDLWNDVPDRLADGLIIVPIGYAIALPWSIELGWLAGLGAVMTAYIRWLGAGLGCGQDYRGPMAKPQRMAVLTVASLIAAVAEPWEASAWVLFAALVLLVIGTLLTAARRLQGIAHVMEAR